MLNLLIVLERVFASYSYALSASRDTAATAEQRITKETKQAPARKDVPQMSLVLRNQKFAFILLAVLTAIVVTFILLTAVAHIDMLHLFTAGVVKPNGGGCMVRC